MASLQSLQSSVSRIAADCLENMWLPAVTSSRLPVAFPWIIMVVSHFFFTLQRYGNVTFLHYRGMEKALVGRGARQALDYYNYSGT